MENIHKQLISKGIMPLLKQIQEEEKKFRYLLYEYFVEHGKAPKILIDCPGGNLFVALDIYDCIKSLPVPVTAIVTGECSSAGLIVLAACTERHCTPNSTFLFHSSNHTTSIKSHFSEKERFAEVWLRRIEILVRKGQEILCKEFNISAEQLFDLEWEGENCNHRIFAEKAKELGVIHEIIEKIPELEAFKK